MKTFNKNFYICAICFALSVSNLFAYSSNSSFSEKSDKFSAANLFDFKNDASKTIFNFDPDTVNSGDDRLIGSWEIKYRLEDHCDATMSFSFQEDGSYSTEAACNDGSLPFQAVGNWSSAGENSVRVEISDYEPKYGAMGQPIKIQRVQTMKYKFINDNQMIFTGMTANRIE